MAVFANEVLDFLIYEAIGNWQAENRIFADSNGEPDPSTQEEIKSKYYSNVDQESWLAQLKKDGYTDEEITDLIQRGPNDPMENSEDDLKNRLENFKNALYVLYLLRSRQDMVKNLISTKRRVRELKIEIRDLASLPEPTEEQRRLLKQLKEELKEEKAFHSTFQNRKNEGFALMTSKVSNTNVHSSKPPSTYPGDDINTASFFSQPDDDEFTGDLTTLFNNTAFALYCY